MSDDNGRDFLLRQISRREEYEERMKAEQRARIEAIETAHTQRKAAAAGVVLSEQQQRQRDAQDIASIYAAGISDRLLWEATADVSDPHQRTELFEFLKASKAAWLAQ